MKKIKIICGSLRADSYNLKLANLIKNNYKEIEIEILNYQDFPLFTEDLEKDFPQIVRNFKEKIKDSDGLIFITPEYNRSIPGALKNAIDWVSRPYGDNSFSSKKALIMGISSGKLGTVSAQNHLKQILLYLDVLVLGQPEIYLGPIKDIYNQDENTFSEKSLELVNKGIEKLINS